MTAANKGLPATEAVLKGLNPNGVLDQLGPFLEQLNPILTWLGGHQQLISDFISDGGASFFARTTTFGGNGTGHYLRQFGPSGPGDAVARAEPELGQPRQRLPGAAVAAVRQLRAAGLPVRQPAGVGLQERRQGQRPEPVHAVERGAAGGSSRAGSSRRCRAPLGSTRSRTSRRRSTRVSRAGRDGARAKYAREAAVAPSARRGRRGRRRLRRGAPGSRGARRVPEPSSALSPSSSASASSRRPLSSRPARLRSGENASTHASVGPVIVASAVVRRALLDRDALARRVNVYEQRSPSFTVACTTPVEPRGDASPAASRKIAPTSTPHRRADGSTPTHSPSARALPSTGISSRARSVSA